MSVECINRWLCQDIKQEISALRIKLEEMNSRVISKFGTFYFI